MLNSVHTNLAGLVTSFILLFSSLCIAQGENNIAAVPGTSIIDHKTENTKPRIKAIIEKMDSLSFTSTRAGHFCKAYRGTMYNIQLQAQDMDAGARQFIEKFELSFADYFFEAFYASQDGRPAGTVWSTFFSCREARPWQFVLLGVNAHINGDMWKSLVNNFSAHQIVKYKKEFIAVQPSIALVYDEVFDSIRCQNTFLRLMNAVTLGWTKRYGENMFLKWRKRSVNLSIMFYHDRKRFEKKLKKVMLKKDHIDKRILSHRS